MLESHAAVALVTLAALLLYFWMGFNVGAARGKFGVAAPATTGHPEFERHFRIHQNTLEWLPLFLPSMWLAAFAVGDRLAAALGVLWIVGRFLYMVGYASDPKRRSAGFLIQFLAVLGLIVLAGIGAVQGVIANGI